MGFTAEGAEDAEKALWGEGDRGGRGGGGRGGGVMRIGFALRLARREGRSSWRRLSVYMGAITLGVAALVAINSYRASVVGSVREEARALLGADLRLSSSRPFPDSVQAVLDSLEQAGTPVSTSVSTLSVVLTGRGATRLVELRAVSGDFPYYGSYDTEPGGLWPGALRAGREALVEPALLGDLKVQVGDSMRIGDVWFRIAGQITNLPAEMSFRSGVAPRVYIGASDLGATQLLQYGSLVQYSAYLALPDPARLDRFVEAHRPLLRRQEVGLVTAERQADRLATALDTLSRFLGLVGLTALLLGGVGVASAVHVFVKDKRDTIAVLRCLGATQGTAFVAYLLQAAMLGLLGAAVGAALGIAAQAALPAVLGELMPVQVHFAVSWGAVLTGLLVGLWVAMVFALLPLLEVRGIPPLRALRQEVEPERRRDRWRAVAYAALMTSILGLSLWQASVWQAGLAFAVGLGITLAMLFLFAWLATRGLHRFFPRRARFVVRQGVANLFRPNNQTTAVSVALGFGVFLVTTLGLVQRNLLDRLRIDASTNAPNLVAFDIQPGQRAPVDSIFRALDLPAPGFTPIVTGRISALNGEPSERILADTARQREGRGGPRRGREGQRRGPERWALRRDYRNTYRDSLTASEQLVAGRWWTTPRRSQTDTGQAALPRISMEEGVAQDLGVGVGDRVTWNFQGVQIETRIANLRKVDWARFDTNFFVVFEPGVLERAPQSFVTLARVEGATRRQTLEGDIVRRNPNVTVVDLALVQETLSRIIDRVMLAVRFMAVFSIVAGTLVLLGAVGATRFQRLREGVLLRTLGASRRQLRQILLTEYLALGSLAGLTGMALGGTAAWLLMRFFFHLPFRLPPLLVVVWPAAAGLAALIGLANSREAVRRTPLAVLREVAE